MGLRRRKVGFTLIELLVTIAVVEILVVVAFNSYRDFTIKAQISEGIRLADNAKLAVNEFYAVSGTYPEYGDAGFAYEGASGKYVSLVDVEKAGVVSATFSSVAPQSANSVLDGTMIMLYPKPNKKDGGLSLTWTCDFTGLPKYKPLSCN